MWSVHVLVLLLSIACTSAAASHSWAFSYAGPENALVSNRPWTFTHSKGIPGNGNIHIRTWTSGNRFRPCFPRTPCFNFPGFNGRIPPPFQVQQTPKPNGVSLVFVIDSTGSMYDDIRQVRRGIKMIFRSMTENHDTSINNFVLVFFNDPLVGPYIVTTEPWRFMEQLDRVAVHGGGDCEERSISGLLLAVKNSLPGSFIFVFTDAGGKDLYLKPQLEALIQQKRSQVIFVLTGNCGNQDDPGYKIYETIAAMSFGQVFNLHKIEVTKILEYVNYTIREDHRVNILSKDIPHPGNETFIVPVDSNIKNMTISLSGKDPVVHVENPEGKDVKGVPVLEVETAVVLNVPHPEHGNWSVDVGSSSDHHVRVYGSSEFNFEYGFSDYPSVKLEDASLSPEIGTGTILLVKVTHQKQLHNLTRVQLKKQEGVIVDTLDLRPVEGYPNMYQTMLFLPPHEQFYLQILGTDIHGFPVERISPTAINPRAPAIRTEVPRWRVPVKVSITPEKVYFTRGESVKLICEADGPRNLLLWWKKDGVVKEMLNSTLMMPREKHVLTLDLLNTNESNEGKYECVASSNWDRDVGTSNVVYVQYPTIINKTDDVLSLENKTVVLYCSIEGKPNPTISWLKNGRKLEPEMYKIFPDGKLLIQHVQVSDAGAFTCIAKNSLGQVQETINLDVGVPPQFSRAPEGTVLPLKGNGILPCQVHGKPEPQIFWRRIDGKEIDKTRITKGESCSLVFTDVKYEDRGTYAVTVQNDFGALEISAVVTISGVYVPVFNPDYQETQVGEGDSIILPCYASGQPPPDYQWIRNGMPISNRAQNTLVLESVQQADAGIYKCEASNVAGNTEKTFNVIVVASPDIQ